jgi:hypothetical protein
MLVNLIFTPWAFRSEVDRSLDMGKVVGALPTRPTINRSEYVVTI